eukprot:TRINITY_DN8382_c0_g1_i2.p1 TRINITY_DN8382_c0_g1~~TRINITY_DN8382_c0_g1_i2.p1  ORF type:complete len:196 (+),score=-10.51 TRINITY_DN8382_c0_g1_i2:757-1344(+)
MKFLQKNASIKYMSVKILLDKFFSKFVENKKFCIFSHFLLQICNFKMLKFQISHFAPGKLYFVHFVQAHKKHIYNTFILLQYDKQTIKQFSFLTSYYFKICALNNAHILKFKFAMGNQRMFFLERYLQLPFSFLISIAGNIYQKKPQFIIKLIQFTVLKNAVNSLVMHSSFLTMHADKYLQKLFPTSQNLFSQLK